VVAGDIMELDSVLVKVVEDCKTELISLTVVRLRSSKSVKIYLKFFEEKLIQH
jgi:hypothetical protein